MEMEEAMEIREYGTFRQDEIMELYASVGWTNYTNRPDMLRQAFEKSLCVLGAYEDEKLIGFIRAVGDGLSIVLIQDIIVRPQYQRMGYGKAMLTAIMERYQAAYQMELLTDDTQKTVSFYRSVGFKAVDEIGCRAFMRM
jgi:ribosomal protein S18 acetylase RimI-like enzyme